MTPEQREKHTFRLDTRAPMFFAVLREIHFMQEDRGEPRIFRSEPRRDHNRISVELELSFDAADLHNYLKYEKLSWEDAETLVREFFDKLPNKRTYAEKQAGL